MRAFVERADGNATLLEIEGMTDASETAVRKEFNDLRDAECRELLDRCGAFLEELRKETARGNLTFAEVEENEDDLVKLRAWLLKIRTRDFFGCPTASAAEAAVARCGAQLEDFTARVLVKEGVTATHGQVKAQRR